MSCLAKHASCANRVRRWTMVIARARPSTAAEWQEVAHHVQIAPDGFSRKGCPNGPSVAAVARVATAALIGDRTGLIQP